MKKNTKVHGHHCTVREQRSLVSQMTRCDSRSTGKKTYDCYLKATQESRENKACMYS